MNLLDSSDRALLDLICSCADRRIRIVSVRTPCRPALRRLRYSGLVGFNDYLPSPSALLDWIERQKPPTTASATPCEELATAADDEGGGDARCGAPSPKRKTYEALIGSKKNTKGASGTARKASSASLSGDAKRIEDRAPTNEPASRKACPSARAHHDPTKPPETPLADLYEVERIKQARRSNRFKQGIRRRAQKLIANGTKPGANGLDSATRGAMRDIAENAEAAARLADPIERAKTLIRIRGWQCFSAVISGGPKGKYYIGNRLVDEAGLIAFAEDLRTRRRVRG